MNNITWIWCSTVKEICDSLVQYGFPGQVWALGDFAQQQELFPSKPSWVSAHLPRKERGQAESSNLNTACSAILWSLSMGERGKTQNGK